MVVKAQRRNPCVMDTGAGQLRRARKSAEFLKVAGAFGKQLQLRRAKYRFQKTQGLAQSGCRLVNAGMRGDANEFMDAGPRKRPGRGNGSNRRLELEGELADSDFSLGLPAKHAK